MNETKKEIREALERKDIEICKAMMKKNANRYEEIISQIESVRNDDATEFAELLSAENLIDGYEKEVNLDEDISIAIGVMRRELDE